MQGSANPGACYVSMQSRTGKDPHNRVLQELICAVDRVKAATNTKKESKALPKNFIGAGKLTTSKI